MNAEMEVKDMCLVVTTKNNFLYQRRKKLGLKQCTFARRIGVDETRYSEIENLKHFPFNKRCGWTKAAKKIADYFKVPPEIIFPKEFEFVEKTKIELELNSAQILLSSQDVPLMLEDKISREDGYCILKKGLQSLTKRQKFIIENRFGLGDDAQEHTLEEISQMIGRSRERVRQIEAVALRKLRQNRALKNHFSEDSYELI